MTDKEWPADSVVRRKVDDLIPYAKNSRTHSDEQVGQIAASIKEWGFTTPILIDPEGGIIAGHGRLMAAQKLGLDEVPTMTAHGWTDAQKRAYIIADNKLALNAGWDDDMLKIELGELGELGERAVADVKRTGEPVKLAPMTAFERKVIHDVVAEAGLRSESEGEGAARRVVVMPA